VCGARRAKDGTKAGAKQGDNPANALWARRKSTSWGLGDPLTSRRLGRRKAIDRPVDRDIGSTGLTRPVEVGCQGYRQTILVTKQTSSRSREDPRGELWRQLAWSDWIRLDDPSPPNRQGIYRVRCWRGKGLLYIGISQNLATRLRSLSRALNRADHRGHYAARGVAEARANGCTVEVSWVVRDPLPRRQLLGEEVDLIAAYRTVFRDSPTCQFGGERSDD
jgi:hypothetical protein